MADFLTDLQVLRKRGRAEIDKGSVIGEYGAGQDRVIAIRNEALGPGSCASCGTSSPTTRRRGSMPSRWPRSSPSTPTT
jgi:hypothetical protein